VDPVNPLDAFAELVRRDGSVDVEEAAMLIAALGRPAVDVEAELGRLDEIAGAVVSPTLSGLCHTLFEELGFRGNVENYYDPANSHLDRVLATRSGIPITLAVVTMAVGRRCGVPVAGVGMPGHFLVRDMTADAVFVDAFDGGRILDTSGCEALYRRISGDVRPFEPTFLDPVGSRDILERMLTNLTVIHLHRGDTAALNLVTRARLCIPGVGIEVVDAAVTTLAASGRWDEAADLIEAAIEVQGDALADEVETAYRGRANGLLARLN
jgi:regulator of sirC expression with transglutaminase-like and TPR domain